MIAWETIDRARAPDGIELVLARRGDEWAVRAAGRVLMSSRVHASEEALASLGLAAVARPREVLVGGLGLGFTLRGVLDLLPATARVTVAELVPAVVAWNRGPLAALAGRPLEDPRVRVEEVDVGDAVAGAQEGWDAVLLDVDNGPSPLAHAANDRLYGLAGARALRAALRPGGAVAVWSAARDAAFLRRLTDAGLVPEEHTPRARGGGRGARHVVVVARRT